MRFRVQGLELRAQGYAMRALLLLGNDVILVELGHAGDLATKMLELIQTSTVMCLPSSLSSQQVGGGSPGTTHNTGTLDRELCA